MRVALYPRVSTQEQAKEGYSIGEQIERLTDYCKAMRWDIYKIYTDPGYSGGDTNRPGLQAMIKDVEAGLVDKVVVYKLDRLSRSQLDTLYLIEKVFLANNTDFVSMSENFDTSTPFGRAMIGILAVFAQLEREQIKERMGMGKEARAKEGKWHGGGTQPIGYDYIPEQDELVINEYEIMQVRELYDLFLQGTPLRAIEDHFSEKGYTTKHGKWDCKTMRNVMRNRLYLGELKYAGVWYKGLHTATIDEKTWERAVKLLDERADQYKERLHRVGRQTTYLGGLLYCKHCGGKYAKQANYRKKEGRPPVWWYMCNSRSKKMRKMIKDPNCKNKNWKMEELDNIVLGEIKKLAMDPNYIDVIREDKIKKAPPSSKIDFIKHEIEKLDTQISRFMDLYGIGKFTIEQVSDKVDPLNEQKRNLERELDSLIGEAGNMTEEELREIVQSFEDIVERGNFNEIRLMIESLIAFIEIDNEDIFIHWKFA